MVDGIVAGSMSDTSRMLDSLLQIKNQDSDLIIQRSTDNRAKLIISTQHDEEEDIELRTEIGHQTKLNSLTSPRNNSESQLHNQIGLLIQKLKHLETQQRTKSDLSLNLMQSANSSEPV